MKRKKVCLLLLTVCLVLGMSGCRKKLAETEKETETMTTEQVTESETQKATETEKATTKTTEAETTSSKTTSNTEKKTTVKPSAVAGNNAATQNNTTNNAASYGTEMCPYCYNQISLQPNGDGTTVYSVHVAQEKAWADTYGYGTDTPNNGTTQTEAQQTEAQQDATAQCPYCYQWYTVADGSYDAHLASHNSNLGTGYVTCPRCGNTYAKGIEYDTHYCTGGQ
ncbi:MAG: hypothetical protein Q4B57_00765 [Eubacteriales bacterium]|nr:hypothetical protein [Eubacteriales bacterium]